LPTPLPFAADVLDRPMAEEIEESFLIYAMSTITARSIPDVRDGLKPVHRRILYDMWRRGITPDKPHVKSAQVVGSCIGSLHPHGDTGVYDALVRMAQPFSLNVPLIDGHGNFGTQDDSPAAYRYTECRLTPQALSLLGELGENAADFVDNFDNTQQEPLYLPGALPNLLVNGVWGIAVGMQSIICPHNLSEIVAALRLLLQSPKCTDKELYDLITGPDFPTGGVLVTPPEEVVQIMTAGTGHIILRAKTAIQQSTKARKDIIITELPWMIGPEKIVSKINKLIKAGSLDQVHRVLDLSDQHQGTRIVVECKPHANPTPILEYLMKYTDLQVTIGVNQIALVDGSPLLLSTRQLLTYYIKHRVAAIQRYATYRMEKIQDRLHLLQGLEIILEDIHRVVQIIESSRTTEEASKALAATFKLDATQIAYILDASLRRLVRVEKEALHAQILDLEKQLKQYKRLSSSPAAQRKELVSQLNEIDKLWGSPRSTSTGVMA